MAITIITPEDLGTGLKVEGAKVVVDRDALTIPVDVKLSGVEVNKDEKKMKFTLSDGTSIEQDIEDFLHVDTDTKVTSGSYAEKKITLRDSENGEVVIDVAGLVEAAVSEASVDAASKVEAEKEARVAKEALIDGKIDELETKTEGLTSKVTKLEESIENIKAGKPEGVVVNSLGGVKLGYFVKEATEASE